MDSKSFLHVSQYAHLKQFPNDGWKFDLVFLIMLLYDKRIVRTSGDNITHSPPYFQGN
jgi:hypothetical protein